MNFNQGDTGIYYSSGNRYIIAEGTEYYLFFVVDNNTSSGKNITIKNDLLNNYTMYYSGNYSYDNGGICLYNNSKLIIANFRPNFYATASNTTLSDLINKFENPSSSSDARLIKLSKEYFFIDWDSIIS